MELDQSKIEKTKEEYIYKAKQLMIKSYKESLDKNSEYSEKSIVINYNGKDRIALPIIYTAVWASKYWANNLLKSTWRYYRSAIIYYAEVEFNNNKLNEKQLEKIKELLKKTNAKEEKKSGNTSNTKKKSFNTNDMKIIDDFLKNSKSKWAKTTRIFIRAARYTGLRPIEWKTVEYNEEKNILIVQNAKNTNGRSFGKTRVLNLDHLDENKIKDIKIQVALVKNIMDKNSWEIYYEGCSALLRRVTRKIWPNRDKYPTIYSCRHQFSADMKASGCSEKEVAALMGHLSDKTAQTHYGKKIYGNRGRKPKVNKNDLIKIKVNGIKKFKFE